ncbi:ComF family protein [Limnobacter parvus]|uniref:ComF family protein n=1 Tax=Limnobacter parvus TaxID=2939690 RepID=A0ABT1XDE9_9BURK|nr:ComF family protein [Limnobacter parvus]
MSKTISNKLAGSPFYRSCWQVSDALFNAALPRRCAACQGGLNNPYLHPLGRHVCNHCLLLIENTPKVRCETCALTLGPRLQAFGWTHCRHCRAALQEPNARLHDCVVCCDYVPPFDQWIAQLKYGKAHGLSKFLGLWLGMAALRASAPLPDLLIPVPSSREKSRQRGYNQAALIARHAGKYIQRPVQTDWLIKIKEAGAQAELGRAERLSNLENAFIATRPIPHGLRIGLVDDVITTGATLESCVQALEKAGAKSIVTMAVCRTPE